MIRMRDRKQFVIRLGMIAVLIGTLCTLVPCALGQTRPEVLAAGASASGAGVAQKRDRALPLPENDNPDMAAGTHRDRLCSGSSILVWQYLDRLSTGYRHWQQQFLLHIRFRWRPERPLAGDCVQWNGLLIPQRVVDVLVQHHASDGNTDSDQSCEQRNLRPLSTGAHAVLEDGPSGGGLQAGDSVLRFNQDYMRELPHCHDHRSTTVRLHL